MDEIKSSFFNAKFDETKVIGDLKPGNPFDKDFQPIKLLKEGVLGKIYLATCQKSDVEKFIKVINKCDYDRWQYKNDIKILKKLNHPNITRYHGSYIQKNKVFVVTEYCNGNELLSEIVINGRLSEKEAQSYFREVLEALCYLHSKKLVHGNLKPNNIIIEKDTKLVKLVNFGFSNHVTQKCVRMVNEFDKLVYNAPELEKGYYTEKNDIWSLGVILYLTLSGNLPFYAESAQKLTKLKKNRIPEFKGYKWDRVSSKAKNFIKKCICYKYKERFSALEALKHPWIYEEANDSIILGHSLISELYTYSKECRLINNIKYFVCAFNELQKKEKDLVKIFKSIDKNKDGELSKAEMINAYRENKSIFNAFKLNEGHIELLFNRLDLDCSGSIDFLEFLVAMKNFSAELNKKNLKKAFDQLSGNDGYLDLNSLNISLGAEVPDNEWLLLLEKYDKDGNKKIDFNEFLAIFNPHN